MLTSVWERKYGLKYSGLFLYKWILLMVVVLGWHTTDAQVSQKYFGRAGRSEIIAGHTILNNGNKIVVGYTWTGTAMSSSDAFIMCLDAADNILWAKEISTPDNDRFISVTATSDGGCVAVGFAGQSSSSVYSGNHAMVYKFDAAGNVLWNRLLKNSANGETFYYAVEDPGSGNISCAGCYNLGAGVSSSLLANFDNAGNLLWAKTYDKNGSDEFRGLAILNGKLIATGIFQGATYYDGTLVAIDESNGNMIWGRSFEYTSSFGGNTSQYPSSLQINQNRIYADVYLMTNYSPGTINPTLVSFDTNGLNPVCLEYPVSGYSYTSDIHSAIVSPNEIYLVQSPGSAHWNPWFSVNMTGVNDAVLTKITSMTNAGSNMVYARKLGNTGDQAFNSIRIHNNRILGFGFAKNDPSMLIGGQDAFMLYADNNFPVTPLSCVEDVSGQQFANPSVTLNPNFTFTEAVRTFPNPSLTPTVTSVHLSVVDPCPTASAVIINHYAAVLAADSCTNTFSVDAAVGFNAGDTVLMIQMKGAQIDQSNSASFGTISDYGNAGNYEFNVIQSVAGNNITLLYTLTNDYDIPGGKVQFVRVPYFQNYTISQTHTALAWDGNKGGVFAINVAGTLTLDADIDVSGYGFKGGSVSPGVYPGCSSMDYFYPFGSGLGGQKGESITELPSAFASGRGAAANGGGGGNNHNAGGGGGANFGGGGRGGDQWSGCAVLPIGGDGGNNIIYSNALNKAFLGGGGGGGQQGGQQSVFTGTSGTNGGGLVMINAGNVVSNNRFILAKGNDNLTTSADDGAGGGGAGGSVLIAANTISGTCDIRVTGGKGGNTAITRNTCCGPGGGGGGGIFRTNATIPSTWSVDATGGISGTGTSPCGVHGSAPGTPGGVLNTLVLPKSNVPFVPPALPQPASNSPLCAGDTLQLSIANSYPSGAAWSWTGPGGFTSSDRDPVVPNRNVTDSGIYTASVSLNGCTVSDTVRVIIFGLPTVNLGNDTNACLSQVPVIIRSPQPAGSQYLWSDGSSASDLQVNTDGKYWLQVTDPNGCVNSDTINVNVTVDPVFDIGNDTLICQNNSVTIGASVPNAAHRWNTGSASPFISVGTAGTYVLEVDLDGCIVRDTLELTVAPLPVVNLGNDTSLCLSSAPLLLQAVHPTGSQYLWSDGSSGAQMTINSTGTYWLRVTSPEGCSGGDTVSVRFIEDPLVDIGPDTIICQQMPLRIGTSVPGADYLWSDGSAGAHIEVSATGTYILQIDLDGCVVSDTILITAMPDPEIGLGEDGNICSGQTIALDATYGVNSSYLWNTGEITPVITVAAEGMYAVLVTSEYGCIATDTIYLRRLELPQISLGPDTTLCEGHRDPVWLAYQQTNADAVTWQDGSEGETFPALQGGSYVATATNQCGSISDTILVQAIFCDIWLPNAFTPDGDGLNDIFRVLGSLGRLQDFELNVFNRWGQVIFYTADLTKGWDGRFKGVEQPVGTYVYLLKYKIDGSSHTLKGNFHLIR